VLVIDRFDRFCEGATPQLADTLRGLRDSFKDALSYIVGMRQEIFYFADQEALGELYELLDIYTCWIQPMAEADARWLIHQETEPADQQVGEAEIGRLLALSGGHPALLKAACYVWLTQPGAAEALVAEDMLGRPAVSYRLEQLWRSLTLAEQDGLQALLGAPEQTRRLTLPDERPILDRLARRGLIHETADSWRIRGELLAAYVGRARHSPGRIWLDEGADILYQGRAPLEHLTPLERSLLQYLVRHPYLRHTHSALI
jgi:hypothetical protein